MGGGEVFVCRLDDNDSNLYLDGSPADLTGQEGDVMVVFLEFWYKWYKVDDNKFLYHFADHNIDGTYIHVPQSLVGAYKGYVSLNRLYSWSDVTPTTNVSLSDFRSYAKARGTGFQVIDFQQHCVIAMMLYAKYKTRNLQGVLGPGGAGSSPATTTGSSNATGGSDSTHYSDYYSRTSDSSLVLARSGYRSYPTGGVAYTDAAYDASDMDSSYGSRLAFHGTISELAPRRFKRLPVL